MPRPGPKSQLPTFLAYLSSCDNDCSICDSCRRLGADGCLEHGAGAAGGAAGYSSAIKTAAADPCIRRLDRPAA